MTKAAFHFSSALALAALALPNAAEAATASACISKPELHGMVAYMLPSVVDSMVSKCSATLPVNSFMTTRAPELARELAKGQPEAWPMAKRAFMKFGGDSTNESSAMMDAMPEAAMRPLVENVMSQEFTGMIKTKDCKDIDAILKALAPLPATNFVDLLTEVVVIGSRDDKEIKICES